MSQSAISTSPAACARPTMLSPSGAASMPGKRVKTSMRMASMCAGPSRLLCALPSLRAEQLDVEDQAGVGRDHAAGAADAVAQLGGDQQAALAAHAHRGHALVPAGDHLAGAEGEGERLAPVQRAIELLTVLQPAGVVHADLLVLLRLC